MIVKRNIIIFVSTLIFIIINYLITTIIITNKTATIKNLENKHKEENEKYITAQILSQKLEQVYTIFENNLAFSKKDKLNKEASMEFLKELTDIIESYDIDLIQIIPGKKTKKGIFSNIPYTLELKCDFEKFGKFIVALEKNNRIIIIDNIYIKNQVERMKLNDENDLSFLDQKIEMQIHTVSLNKSITI